MLQCWILGTEHGNAIADIMSGDKTPTAKTVMSFPYAVGQLPVYYNHFNTGRPTTDDPAGNWYSRYRDIPRDALYPFGFGLSYTSFAYSNIKISASKLKSSDKLTVSVTVKNSGNKSGEEIVQLYIRDYAASVVRPVKELKGYQRVTLDPGASEVINFTIGTKELSFYDADGKQMLEPGKFAVMIGGNSRDVMSADFEME